ncbi:hypothetical protein [Fulvivirga lutea]|uniref:Uncharacterized protein n=1 Tax=Fulvivirga lutea TaxID=2810512 RepID=A0A974WE97_9BACT|nr:hypothetical protein [Fulvivirga lutea]QSE96688.1 hypothetical protein JR347_13940 [Fulvivirga lutea]
MLFLFRKVRRKMLDDNKVTNYLLYALGEIVLVVIGILIAFQLEELREDYVNEEKEIKHLKLIRDEFNYNNEQLQNARVMHKFINGSTWWLVEHMPLGYGHLNSDSLKYHLARTFGWHTYDPSMSSIEAIINSGSLELISNDSLKYLITTWKDVVEDYNEDEYILQDLYNNNYVRYFQENISLRDFVAPWSLENLESLNSFKCENVILEQYEHRLLVLDEMKTVQERLDRILSLTESELKKKEAY